MRISKAIPTFDYDKLARGHQVFMLRTSEERFLWSDSLYDELAQKATVESVVFEGGTVCWAMLAADGSGQSARSVIRGVVASRDDVSFEPVPLRRVPDRILLRLCINSIGGSLLDVGASNVTGKLIVVKAKHVEGPANSPRVIHGLEVGVSPRMGITLDVRTFTSCAIREFSAKLTRYEVVDGTHIRRARGSWKGREKKLFVQRAPSSHDHYGKYSMLDARSLDNVRSSKLGVLLEVIACLDEAFAGAVRVDFEEVADSVRLPAQASGARINRVLKRVAELLSERPLVVVDETGEAEDAVRVISAELSRTFGITATVADKPRAEANNIRVILGDDAYGKGYDPHDHVEPGVVIQHMTPDAAKDPKAIQCVAKELAVKRDVADGVMRVCPGDPSWGDWRFCLKLNGPSEEDEGEKKNKRPTLYATVSTVADRLLFRGPFDATGVADEADAALVEALETTQESGLAVARGDDVNVVTRSELFGLPRFETLDADYLNGENLVGKHAWVSRGKLGVERYFADAVDVASCVVDESLGYYRAGMHSPGMDWPVTYRASILREVVATPGSRLLVDDMLPMLDVDFVRLGNPTVLPYPVKYLREWLASNLA